MRLMTRLLHLGTCTWHRAHGLSHRLTPPDIPNYMDVSATGSVTIWFWHTRHDDIRAERGPRNLI